MIERLLYLYVYQFPCRIDRKLHTQTMRHFNIMAILVSLRLHSSYSRKGRLTSTSRVLPRHHGEWSHMFRVLEEEKEGKCMEKASSLDLKDYSFSKNGVE
jgi:hypothetical protein